MFTRTLLAGAAVSLMMAGASWAATHEVKMLNKGEAGVMVFEPAFIKAEVGDTVVFLPTDKGHNAETIKGMLPEGVDMVVGKMNKEMSITLDAEGLYGIMCKPHYAMGMVALIQAGDPVNLEEASEVKHRAKSKKVFKELFEQVEE